MIWNRVLDRSTRDRRTGALQLVVGAAVALATLLVAAPAHAAPEPPVDPGTDWSLVESSTDDATATDRCTAADSWTWTRVAQGPQGDLTLRIAACDSRFAAQGMYEWLKPPVPASHRNRGEGIVAVMDGRVIRSWAGSAPDAWHLVTLETRCEAGTDCTGLNDVLFAQLLPGLAGAEDLRDPAITVDLFVISAGALAAVLAIPVVPVMVVNRLRRPRLTSPSGQARYHDVTAMVRRGKFRRRVRRGLWWVLAALALIGLGTVAMDPLGAIGIAIIMMPFFALLLTGHRWWARPHPVERGRRVSSGRGPAAVAGAALSTFAVGLMLVLLTVFVVYVTYVSAAEGWPSLTSADLERMDLPLLALIGPAAYASDSGAVAVVALPVFLALFTAAISLDWVGRRLRAAPLAEALAQDRRPHYLYLRSFDEDSLRLPATLHRRGWIANFSILRKIRFEEVLVRQLSATGPVIAIAPPGAALPPIGAARASFDDDQWQQHVAHYAATARAVVLSATPKQVRQGYDWELDLVANWTPHGRVMVVLGPWSRTELAERWTQFCHAVHARPFFAPITMPWVPDGVQVLAHGHRFGWHAWGARRRSDWTYAMSIDQATRAFRDDWGSV